MLQTNLNAKQARIFTAVMLSGILSVSSGFILMQNATALPINFLAETPKEVVKQNVKLEPLPRAVANAVLQDINHRDGIATKKLKIIDSIRKTWRNGCLELQRPDELCTQALVPGWRVVVARGQQKWVYHTNETGSVVRRKENDSSTLRPLPIPASELPPPLDRNVVFRQISSGGFIGRTYETVLLNDGRLIRVRIGDANDSERSVRRVTSAQVRQFQRVINRAQGEFQNLSYPASRGAADYVTYTLTSRKGTVQYNDISQNNLPQDLQTAVKAWKQIVSTAR
ncbi:hypothetical protein [Anabaena sp. UHCC 0399]|uniref:hypothetical protein n=1 Tax=Anabaena sp. UHCC 0399 TaxID=3110238 RepID=UPI002B21E029|nr:hypothetical protein [Anabaena sp. UHCC 0399]MEA5563961.1 hypothetical protein [Anabaena sp. UHCC 0399]